MTCYLFFFSFQTPFLVGDGSHRRCFSDGDGISNNSLLPGVDGLKERGGMKRGTAAGIVFLKGLFKRKINKHPWRRGRQNSPSHGYIPNPYLSSRSNNPIATAKIFLASIHCSPVVKFFFFFLAITVRSFDLCPPDRLRCIFSEKGNHVSG